MLVYNGGTFSLFFMKTATQRRENPWINIVVNVVFPTIILTKVSPHVGVVWGLLIAMSLPLGYGVWNLISRRTWNFFSIIGIASILFTAGIGLLQLGPDLLAWKEALVPTLIGTVILATVWSPFPIMKKMLESLMNWERIEEILREKKDLHKLDRLTRVSTALLAGSLYVSGILNYVLAKVIVTSPAGTDAFNAELGHMTALSLPVITLPSFIMLFGVMIYLVKTLLDLTGLDVDDLMLTDESPSQKEKGTSVDVQNV